MRLAVLFLVTSLGSACAERPCSAERSSCECYARNGGLRARGGTETCRLVTDSCWCPSECGERVQCFCGGGKFVRCEDATDSGE